MTWTPRGLDLDGIWLQGYDAGAGGPAAALAAGAAAAAFHLLAAASIAAAFALQWGQLHPPCPWVPDPVGVHPVVQGPWLVRMKAQTSRRHSLSSAFALWYVTALKSSTARQHQCTGTRE